MRFDAALMWFRRDLRMADNAALYHALKSSRRVFCVFVFDRTILDALPSRTGRRVEFIHASLIELDAALRHHGGALIVQHGNATQDIPALAQALKVDAVFTNHDYEPAATARDAAVAQQLKTCGIALHTFKDQVLFEKDEILTGSGTFYPVFTPYKNAVLKKLDAFYLGAYPVERYFTSLAAPALPALAPAPLPALRDIGFAPAGLDALGIRPGETGAQSDEHFAAWCEGRTGYPLIDAAMRQLNQTGYMHNRLRMVTASFLTKDLGIDWRRGERYFADQLIDFDLPANNGGWQWAASTGCDAQPWFRIFNPVTQSQKFDADGKFIRRYVPEVAGLSGKAIHAPWLAKADELKRAKALLGENYPLPIVDHTVARTRTLARFAAVTGANRAA